MGCIVFWFIFDVEEGVLLIKELFGGIGLSSCLFESMDYYILIDLILGFELMFEEGFRLLLLIEVN